MKDIMWRYKCHNERKEWKIVSEKKLRKKEQRRQEYKHENTSGKKGTFILIYMDIFFSMSNAYPLYDIC